AAATLCCANWPRPIHEKAKRYSGVMPSLPRYWLSTFSAAAKLPATAAVWTYCASVTCCCAEASCVETRHRQNTIRIQRRRIKYSLQRQALQIFPEWPAQVVALKREFNRSFQEAELVSGIVAFAVELESIDGTAAQEQAQRIGELDFAARPRLH